MDKYKRTRINGFFLRFSYQILINSEKETRKSVKSFHEHEGCHFYLCLRRHNSGIIPGICPMHPPSPRRSSRTIPYPANRAHRVPPQSLFSSSVKSQMTLRSSARRLALRSRITLWNIRILIPAGSSGILSHSHSRYLSRPRRQGFRLMHTCSYKAPNYCC